MVTHFENNTNGTFVYITTYTVHGKCICVIFLT